MVRFTFSDEEIEELLRNAEGKDENDDIIIDERTFGFWMKGSNGMPVPTVDFKYGIFILERLDYGDRTDHYWVYDTRENSFSYSLPEFLEKEGRGELPEKLPEKKKKDHFLWLTH